VVQVVECLVSVRPWVQTLVLPKKLKLINVISSGFSPVE
jgi:hypothetical protein